MTTDTIADVMGPERTIGCVIEIASMMFDPGVVSRHTPRARSWFALGAIDKAAESRASEIAALLRHSGSVDVVADIRSTKWMKLVSNATALVPTALLGLPIKDAVEMPGMRNLMLRAGQEAFDATADLGFVPLPVLGLTAQDMREVQSGCRNSSRQAAVGLHISNNENDCTTGLDERSSQRGRRHKRPGR